MRTQTIVRCEVCSREFDAEAPERINGRCECGSSHWSPVFDDALTFEDIERGVHTMRLAHAAVLASNVVTP